MNQIESSWSTIEQETAQKACQKACQREINALLSEVRDRANKLVELEQLWQLHDFLSARRHEIDGKYDDNYPAMIFILANLIKEGWLNLDEIASLEKDKLAKIAALSRM